ncbi:unnamed protein product [Moneuplotes crassus]|uniref:Calpain catalytic domain-containing protein n=1 Tax=Euplotes crassus TaxID=5936 RepID=A0AAD1Y5K1_EUPCR|nr:unnamed protein product [Moneuplotes crassus]
MDESRIERATTPYPYEDIIKEGELFEDPHFGPCQESLFNELECKMDPKIKKLWSKFEWKRASLIYKDGFKVFDNKPITPLDLKQGLLGTCYFVSSIASAASNFTRITELFVIKKPNKSGIYAVRFIINGKYQIVTVDDYFPVDPKSQLPAFSRSTKNLIWPLVLEKAWAKLNGSFENIMQGYPQDVLSFIMPGLSKVINLRREDNNHELWKILIQALYKNHIICGITYKAIKGVDLKLKGLVPNHCYSVIGCTHFTVKRTEHRLVRLYNPWGTLEWKGHWSKTDKRWTKSLLNSSQCDILTPGCFYIPFEYFLKYFKVVTITENEPEYKFQSLTLTNNGDFSAFILDLHENSYLYLSVNQINQRLLQEECKKAESSVCNIMIARINPSKDSLIYVDGKFSQERELVWNSQRRLQKGKYLVYAEIEWSEETKCIDYYSSCYSENKVIMEDVTGSYKKKDLLEKMLIACAQKKTKPYEYSKEASSEEPGLKIDLKRAMSVEDTGCDYGYIFYTNDTPSSVLSEELNFGSMAGYVVDDEEDTPKINIDLEPGKQKLVLLKRNSDRPMLSVGFKSKISYDTEDLIKNIKTKGKKHQVKTDCEEFEIYFYVLEHPKGYIFQYENNEKTLEFEAAFDFKLKNLKIVEQARKEKLKQRKEWGRNNASSTWKVFLKPGCKVIKKLEIINDYDAVAYKQNYKFKTIDTTPQKVFSNASLKTSIKKRGQKYPLVDEAKIDYYVYNEIKGSYYFMFTNSGIKTLECDAQFELENIKLVDSDGPENTWKFSLKPGQCLIKQALKIIQRDKCSLCPSFTYKLS